MAPSITWRNGGMDSGDLATGVAVLDFIHPPGYPLFVLLAHGFWRALPGVEPAFATNLFCGILAAIATAVAYVAGRTYLEQNENTRASPILLRSGASLATAFALASGPLWWQQANLATVHAGNVLLASVVLLCAVWLWAKLLTWRLALFCGCALGLAMTHHLTLLGLPAAFVASMLFGMRRWQMPAIRGMLNRSILLAGIAGTFLSLVPWAILLWLGVRSPTHIWGDLTSLSGFLDVVLARQYHELLAKPTFTSVLYRSSRAIWTLAQELGPIAFLVGLGGLGLLWETDRRYVRFVLFSVLFYVVFFAFYSARDVESYLLPVALAMVPAVAYGLARVTQWLMTQRPKLSASLIVPAVPLLTLSLGIALNFSTMNLRGDIEASAYARTALAEAPERAVLITEGDRHSFALWYVHYGLGVRPDVTIVDRWFLKHRWYRAYVARLAPDVHILESGEMTGQMLASGVVSQRPIVVTNGENWGTALRRGQLLYEVVRSPT